MCDALSPLHFLLFRFHCEQRSAACHNWALWERETTTLKYRQDPLQVVAMLGPIWSICTGCWRYFWQVSRWLHVFCDHWLVLLNRMAANKMGIDRKGQVCVLIHSGSRGLGHQVCFAQSSHKWVVDIVIVGCDWCIDPNGKGNGERQHPC